MIRELNITVSPKVAATHDELLRSVAVKFGIAESEITHLDVFRRSIDARSRNVRINLGVRVYVGEEPVDERVVYEYPDVSKAPEVVIVGAGPAGLFAALRLIELGVKPVIVERGKKVSERKADIAAIHRNEAVHPDSNYGYGEGGAGTFSDGKLYTRSKKRGDIRKIIEVLFQHGAQSDILIDAHPHIGTNVLPKVVKNIRKTILEAGGEIHFRQRVTDFIVSNDRVVGVSTASGERFSGKAVILATGHSARDIYHLLRKRGIHLEAKPFAVGVRVEHPQQLIDTIQYHRNDRGPYLPAAAYSFAEQVDGRGVYSFCMCPGGVVVPAATSNDELVVNGMSPSHRGGKWANSGIVVEVQHEDLKRYGHHREMAGLKFQEDLEHQCYKMAQNSQIAPAQRLNDFVKGMSSSSLPSSSYHPGVAPSDMHAWMPAFIRERLQSGFRKMDSRAHGFLTNEAIILGVETRTSSPVRIPRNEETLEHVKVSGLYPCGEGSGYSGGIVSSAVDGERVAESVARMIK
ncbi:NAD(P)/FAD-dependent oxidoreductase [Roseimarinus sediminis]|uniref:NAD(P)/FAD-dependent oxidoreductase n=1 Tax=Roseimarinus sediminis TaxID=1610899 RepID=UPI003D1B5849